MLLISCFVWSGALDLLLRVSSIILYNITSIAYNQSNILISTLKHTHLYSRSNSSYTSTSSNNESRKEEETDTAETVAVMVPILEVIVIVIVTVHWGGGGVARTLMGALPAILAPPALCLPIEGG